MTNLKKNWSETVYIGLTAFTPLFTQAAHLSNSSFCYYKSIFIAFLIWIGLDKEINKSLVGEMRLGILIKYEMAWLNNSSPVNYRMGLFIQALGDEFTWSFFPLLSRKHSIRLFCYRIKYSQSKWQLIYIWP